MYHVNAGDLPGNEVSRTFEGGRHGPCSVSFFLVHNQPGQGPRLHHHPYDETFVILEGHVRVSVGNETLDGGPGDIVIGPAGVGWPTSRFRRPRRRRSPSVPSG